MADQQTKDLIFGYIRKMEVELELSIIPPLISMTCLVFYYVTEFIATYDPRFRISEDKLSISNESHPDDDHAIYLNQWIPSIYKTITTWTFKINSFEPEQYEIMYIGIVSKITPLDKDCFCSDDGCTPNYVFGMSGPACFAYQNGHIGKDVGTLKFKGGDTILFTLNLKETSFSVKINDENEFILFNDIKTSPIIEYKMALQMYEIGNQVTLKQFSHKF